MSWNDTCGGARLQRPHARPPRSPRRPCGPQSSSNPAEPQVPAPPAADPRPQPRRDPLLLPALISAALSAAAPSSSSPRQTAGDAASTVTHNTLIERLAGRGRGGARGCSAEDALAASVAMRAAGVAPNGFTFTFLLHACESFRRLPPCRFVHSQIVRCGFGADEDVQNALLNVTTSAATLGMLRLLEECSMECLTGTSFRGTP